MSEATRADFTGNAFTNTYHIQARGPTNPANNKLPPNYMVVVTGAGKGLGYHISLAYAKAGAGCISISSRTQSDLDKLSDKLRSINPDIKIISTITDTTKDSDVKDLAGKVESTFGRVDAVIANAGIISKYVYDADGSNRHLPTGILDDDDFDRVTMINYLGSVKTARYFLPLLAKTKDGTQSFVVITSIAAHYAMSTYTPPAYNISKVAVNRLAEHLHNDHYEKDGILAFAVHPGAVLTPQTELHSNTKGDAWDQILTEDVGLCGGWLTWLTKERREWLSGRYLSVNWDVDELEAKKDEILRDDKLKYRMVL